MEIGTGTVSLVKIQFTNFLPNSLIATIKSQRPELLISHKRKALPIPLNPPLDFFHMPNIPGVGELMLASFPFPEQFFVDPENNW